MHAQRPLSDRYLLRLINRRGFGNSPEVDGEDFEADAADAAEVLGDGAHLVGHSYGAVVALLAAARRPGSVRSLTVVEPPAFAVVADRPDVRDFIVKVEALIAGAVRPEDFLPGFTPSLAATPGGFPRRCRRL